MNIKKDIKFLLIFFLIFIFVYRSLLANITSHLPDWYDYPLVVWIIDQNITNILNLNFTDYFTTNAFFPHKNSLLFADIFLPQALITLPFYVVSKNLILSFNITFILTFVLNYISSYLFWKLIFKKEKVAFIGALLVVFSPYVHTQLSHFQMISFWPFFFSLYFLFKQKDLKIDKNTLLSGLFLAIQFLASAYLAIFLFLVIMLYYLIKILKTKEYGILKQLGFIFLIFLLLDLVFIKGYLDTGRMYEINRDYGEYVLYSAHVSDYVFSKSISSVLHQSSVMTAWNNFSHHGVGELASFPGFVLTILALLGLLQIKRRKDSLGINMNTDILSVLFITIACVGLIFSIGPRIQFNGNYDHIPLPYHFVTKIPMIDSIRAVARWSFLFYFGLIFFALSYIKNKLSTFVLLAVVVIIIIEYVPINIQTHAETYIDKGDITLIEYCDSKEKILLNIPVTHFDAGDNISEGLKYISKTQLASTKHNCMIINGYSGYDMPEIQDLKDNVIRLTENKEINELLSLFKENDITIVKFSLSATPPHLKEQYKDTLESLEKRSDVEFIGENIFLIK